MHGHMNVKFVIEILTRMVRFQVANHAYIRTVISEAPS
jgi:hypothetical protein